IYNLHRIITIPAKEVETLSGMHGFIAQHQKWVYAAMLFAAMLSFICLFFMSWQSIIALAVLGAVAVFYTFPLPFGIRLRDFGYLKPFIVATVWSFVAVL